MSEDDDQPEGLSSVWGNLMEHGSEIDALKKIVGTIAHKLNITEEDIIEFSNPPEGWSQTREAAIVRAILHPVSRWGLDQMGAASSDD